MINAYPIGYKFGDCTLIKYEPTIIDKGGHYRKTAMFMCKCGKSFVTNFHSVKRGLTTSCGCFRKKRQQENRTHGATLDKINSGYNVWLNIKSRCLHPNSTSYTRYGAKGITICERWEKSYEAFISDMGERPSVHHSIDRYPNKNGNYEPNNCRWATPIEQSNNKNKTIMVSYMGTIVSLANLCRQYNINYKSAHLRFHKFKWNMEDVIKRGIENKEGINYTKCRLVK